MAHDLLTGLVALYKLNEASGNALDAHGGYTLTETSGTIDSVPGKIGNGRDFEAGDTEHFLRADGAPFDIGDNNCSFWGWGYFESSTGTRVILSKLSTAGQYSYEVHYNATSGCLVFLLCSDGTNLTTLNASTHGVISNGTWFFFYADYDAATDTARISVNNGAFNTTTHAGGFFNSTAGFSIGARSNNSANFDGVLDEIGISSRKLTADEITLLYGGGAGLAYENYFLADPPLADGVWGQFSLHSTKGTLSEITALAGEKPYFPRHLDLAACRTAGLTLHSSLNGYDHAVTTGSDHAASTGLCTYGLWNDPEDAWTWLSPALFSLPNQREAVHPVLDEENDRILYSCHDNNSNGNQYNSQHAVLMSSTNGTTLTTLDSNICNFPANHSGYGQLLKGFDGTRWWTYLHHMTGGEDFWLGSSYTSDPGDFIFGEHFFVQMSHVIGQDKVLSNGAWLASFGGKNWYIGLVENRNAVDDNSVALVAIEVLFSPGMAPRPVGGFYTLYTDSADTSNATYNLTGDFSLLVFEEQLYLIGTGRTQAGTQHVVLLKMSTTEEASYTAPLVEIDRETASPVRPMRVNNVFSWDARRAALPSDLVAAAVAGTNNSTRTDGVGYSLTTGSGVSQNLTLTLNNHNLNPSEHECLDVTIHGVKFNPSANNQLHGIKFGQATNNSAIYFNTSGTHDGGRLRVYDGGSAVFDDDAHILPFNNSSANVADFARSRGFTLTFRLQDHGDTLLILLTDPNKAPRASGQVVFYADLSSYDIAWEDCFLQLQSSSSGSPFAVASFDFTKISIDTYEAGTVPKLGVFSPGVLV